MNSLFEIMDRKKKCQQEFCSTNDQCSHHVVSLLTTLDSSISKTSSLANDATCSEAGLGVLKNILYIEDVGSLYRMAKIPEPVGAFRPTSRFIVR